MVLAQHGKRSEARRRLSALLTGSRWKEGGATSDAALLIPSNLVCSPLPLLLLAREIR